MVLYEIGTKEVDLKSEKEVAITIAEEDFEILKNAEYRLCFAKKVNDTYNVVWQSYKQYFEINQFAWKPVFEIFCTMKFQAGVQVIRATEVEKITLGQTIVLDENGRLGEPYTGGPYDSITLENDFGSISPAISQVSIGVNGLEEVTPIYVVQRPSICGKVILTPVDKVLIWFEQVIETSTMFSESRSKDTDVDLTFKSSEKRLYKEQEWSVPK